MAGMTGGIADKLGNRYEGLWVARLLIRLLAGELACVLLEALGDAEEGVDVWTTDTDGKRHAYQCKRKNRMRGQWSLSRLAGDGVLAKMAAQLGRDPDAQFTFVSTHPAAELRELADLARTAGEDEKVFFQVTGGTKAHGKNLAMLREAVRMDADTETARHAVFMLLRRIDCHLFEDSRAGDADLRAWAGCHVADRTAEAVETLANFAQDRLGQPILVDDVRSHLTGRGYRLLNLSGDANVGARVERLRSEFCESDGGGLAGRFPVAREATDLVFRRIQDVGASRLQVIHGRAGDGKSTVLRQLTGLMNGAGILFLPLRLDVRPPGVSAHQYGVTQCALPAAPGAVLHSCYPGRISVLILDQLDSIRWTSSHAAARWEACREMIEAALALPNIVVVLACRTFDLRDDQQIRSWLEKHKTQETPVGEFTDDEVKTVVSALGGDSGRLTAKQRQLLRSPLLLSLWHDIGGPQAPDGWSTLSGLMRMYWRLQISGLAKAGISNADARAVINELVTLLDRGGGLSVPARCLDAFDTARSALLSAGALRESNGRVQFAHQRHFEYLLADRLTASVAAGNQTVTEWLRAGDQSLLRRDQLRLLLTMLRDDSPGDFVTAVRELLFDDRIRFHLKHLTLGVMGDITDPSPQETDLGCELASRPGFSEHLLDLVVIRSAAWFDGLERQNLLGAWLLSGEGPRRDFALRVCHFLASRRGDQVARLMTPLVDSDPPAAARALPFDPDEDSDALFEQRLRLVHCGRLARPYLSAERLAEQAPRRLIRLLEAFFDAPEANRKASDFPNRIPIHDAAALTRAAEADAERCWTGLMPRILRVCETNRETATWANRDGELVTDSVWRPAMWRARSEPFVDILDIIARAGAVFAGRDPAGFAKQIGSGVNHPSLSVQYTLGVALAGADVAAGWLCGDARRLSIRDGNGRRCGIARLVIGRHASKCSPEAYRELEATIMKYQGPDERRSVISQASAFREWNTLQSNIVGLSRHAILPAFPPERLSDPAKSESGVLERKFRRPADEVDPPLNLRVYWDGDRTPAGRPSRLTDLAWLNIIRCPPASRRFQGLRHHRGNPQNWGGTGNFALLLGHQTCREPARFVCLGLRLDDTAGDVFVEAILRNAGDDNPPTDAGPEWSCATDDSIVALVERHGGREDRAVAIAACRLMGERATASWTRDACRILCRHATTHPNPDSEDSVCSIDDKDRWEIDALNCVRAVAVTAIGSLVEASSARLDEFLPAIRHAVTDFSPAVRIAAAGVCGVLFERDENIAVDLFLQTCETIDAILSSRQVADFIGIAFMTQTARLRPLIERMANSPDEHAAENGAFWLAVWHLYLGELHPLLESCRRGTAAQRTGVAAAAAGGIGDRRRTTACADLLRELVDDPDEKVQEAAARAFCNVSDADEPEVLDLAIRFAAGPGLASRPFWLMDFLTHHAGSLVPLADLVFAVSRRLSGDLSPAMSDPANRHAHEFANLPPVVLRLYDEAEQAGNEEVRTQCLDWWDQLLAARLHGVREVIHRLDSGA
ncbi:hypothetical protein [Zavarzinella formosa]|uniref:hypothetical protein n=1 Tax=Zavarzinella formosa TaxID=360055 RepID=UPI0002DEA282|nr:hypothetical protein [Zavarzinella formosa]